MIDPNDENTAAAETAATAQPGDQQLADWNETNGDAMRAVAASHERVTATTAARADAWRQPLPGAARKAAAAPRKRLK